MTRYKYLDKLLMSSLMRSKFINFNRYCIESNLDPDMRVWRPKTGWKNIVSFCRASDLSRIPYGTLTSLTYYVDIYVDNNQLTIENKYYGEGGIWFANHFSETLALTLTLKDAINVVVGILVHWWWGVAFIDGVFDGLVYIYLYDKDKDWIEFEADKNSWITLVIGDEVYLYVDGVYYGKSYPNLGFEKIPYYPKHLSIYCSFYRESGDKVRIDWISGAKKFVYKPKPTYCLASKFNPDKYAPAGGWDKVWTFCDMMDAIDFSNNHIANSTAVENNVVKHGYMVRDLSEYFLENGPKKIGRLGYAFKVIEIPSDISWTNTFIDDRVGPYYSSAYYGAVYKSYDRTTDEFYIKLGQSICKVGKRPNVIGNWYLLIYDHDPNTFIRKIRVYGEDGTLICEASQTKDPSKIKSHRISVSCNNSFIVDWIAIKYL